MENEIFKYVMENSFSASVALICLLKIDSSIKELNKNILSLTQFLILQKDK